MDKSAIIKANPVKNALLEFCRDSLVWAAAGFLLEIVYSENGLAPTGAALAAGLSGIRGLWAFTGGALGALLHGIPQGITELASLGIALAARILPDAKNKNVRCIVRFIIAAAAVFFPRSASVSNPVELLYDVIAALSAGIFAFCVCRLSDSVPIRGFDINDSVDRALAAAVTGLGFMALAGLEFAPFNLGCVLIGFMLLSVTAKNGITYGAVFGIPAVFGLCAADGSVGRDGAVICFAVLLSGVMSKYGKISRAISFVFFGCLGVLLEGADGSSWRIVTEFICAGIMFTVIPIEKIGESEPVFRDAAIGMMIKERLRFAADALTGVGTGLNAAAETLDRKYCMTLTSVSDYAAQKACGTCPNNMICWGQKYEIFHNEFNRLVKLLRSGNELTVQSISPLAAEECISKDMVIRGVKTAYSRYLAAAEDDRRIKEMRRIYTEQLESVHDILESMGNSAGKTVTINRNAEKRVEDILQQCGLNSPAAFISFGKHGVMLLEAYGSGELKADREYLGEMIIKALGREMELPNVSCSGGRIRITSSERTCLSAEIGAYQLNKGQNRISGDCYDSFTDAYGSLYIILSDGMGTGSRARIDSALAVSMMTRLLKSGIPLAAALETVNTSLMVKSADESFATLDICKIDLNSGDGVLYKAGAAATYIKCSDRLVRASLPSSPIGTGGKITVPAQKFHVECGDVIIMTTDGVSLDEDWLSHELSSKSSPKELSEKIARTARSSENGKQDDLSVITITVGK